MKAYLAQFTKAPAIWAVILLPLVALSVVAAPGSVHAQEGGYTFVRQWGSQGSGPGQFNYATGVAVDAAGTIYACDADNQRIQKLAPDGTFIAAWGTEGAGPGQFSRPYSAALDSQGNVYVVDEWNHRIQRFTADGVFVTTWGHEGGGKGEFNLPHGVAVNRQGLVYVVDEWNHRVQVFRPEGGAPPATVAPTSPAGVAPTSVPAAGVPGTTPAGEPTRQPRRLCCGSSALILPLLALGIVIVVGKLWPG
jgi:DNA-binding beta-propeller fold protein YncE